MVAPPAGSRETIAICQRNRAGDRDGTRLQIPSRRSGPPGNALAQVLGQLHRQNPARPMHMIAHFLGANLTFEALRHPDTLPLHRLRAGLPDRPSRYWSRLLRCLFWRCPCRFRKKPHDHPATRERS